MAASNEGRPPPVVRLVYRMLVLRGIVVGTLVTLQLLLSPLSANDCCAEPHQVSGSAHTQSPDIH